MDELLALLGQHWRLVALYPGGLTVFGALLVVYLLGGGSRRRVERWGVFDVLVAACNVLVVTLLPLPQTGWPYPLDVAVLLLLVEVPYWANTFRRGDRAVPGVIDALNVYPLLIIAIAALGQAARSLVLLDINRATGPLHWAGLAAWALTLPPLLGLGPWRSEDPLDPLDLLGALRRVAHLGLILAAALPAHDDTPRWLSLVGFVCLVIPLAALDRWWRGDAQRWIAWQPWLVGGAALLVAGLSGQQFMLRLR